MVLRFNLPLEIHASKVYTSTMFEQFGKLLYEAGQYMVEEMEHPKLYLVRHEKAAQKEKWFKIVFRVAVDIETEEVNCECGLFEHSGIPCAHSLKDPSGEVCTEEVDKGRKRRPASTSNPVPERSGGACLPNVQAYKPSDSLLGNTGFRGCQR